MKTELSIFEERLSRAERQVRVLRGLLVAVLLGAVVIATARPALTQEEGADGASPSTVKAPFVIVDESGKPLMVVKRSTLGGRFGELKILDPEGRSVAGLESFTGRGRVFSAGTLGTSYLGK